MDVASNGWSARLYWLWILYNSVAFVVVLTAVAVLSWISADVLHHRCGQAITQRQHPTQAGRPSAKPDMTRVDEWVAAHTLLSPCLKRSAD